MLFSSIDFFIYYIYNIDRGLLKKRNPLRLEGFFHSIPIKVQNTHKQRLVVRSGFEPLTSVIKTVLLYTRLSNWGLIILSPLSYLSNRFQSIIKLFNHISFIIFSSDVVNPVNNIYIPVIHLVPTGDYFKLFPFIEPKKDLVNDLISLFS